jgi:hypothetical protein
MMQKVLIITAVLISLVTGFGCGPSAQKPKTEPVKPAEPVPDIEALRKPVAKDPGMYKITNVIKEYGQFKKKYMSYEKYQKLTGGQANAALDPDWFYDSYHLNMKEKGYYITVTWGSSKRAKDRDPRIEKIMAGLPNQAITIKLDTPKGNSYVLSDAECDGILDYAANAKIKNPKIDIKLLDAMQEKYTWIIGILKTHYKKK